MASPPVAGSWIDARDAGTSTGGWLERWLSTTRELSDLQASHPMVDAVVDEVRGRAIRVGDQWLADFASCNYLGLDLDREIIEAVPGYLDAWGTHPSWSRLIASPVLFNEIEAHLASLLGAEDALAFPTITHIHASVIPLVAGDGTIFVDARAHKTLYDGCRAAASNGAALVRYAHNDTDRLERLLERSWRRPGVICTDGVNSMTGNAPDVRALAWLARDYDCLLYIDDAHGFGVLGERAADELCSYGRGGNGVVRYQGESYDHVLLVGGLSKAYSSLLAFVACPSSLKRLLKTAAPPYAFSGPPPVASLATAIEGLRVNEHRGDAIRADLHRKTRRVLDTLAERAVCCSNCSDFPLIEVPLADAHGLSAIGELLFQRGIYATLVPYPVVPREDVGFRLQVTAANSNDQIDRLCSTLDELAPRLKRAV